MVLLWLMRCKLNIQVRGGFKDIPWAVTSPLPVSRRQPPDLIHCVLLVNTPCKWNVKLLDLSRLLHNETLWFDAGDILVITCGRNTGDIPV